MLFKQKPKLIVILALSIVLVSACSVFLIHKNRSAYTPAIDESFTPSADITYSPSVNAINTPSADVTYIPATDVYEFPITADKTPDEWKELEDYSEKLAVLQIPEDVLATISTKGLFETCLNYPFIINMLMFNYYQDAFDSLCSFNGLQELLKRPDAGSIILSYYKSIDFNNLEKYSNFPSCFITYIEMMLAQDSILSGMEPSERKELLDLALKKHKKNASSLTDIWIGRILKIESKEFQEYLKQNPKDKEFIDRVPVVSTPPDWDKIVEKFVR
ncbi:hypothetical protein [Acetivibrio clariflavus]|uniref:hypothetical protein n=1 Tax=Acetivibrio clariflavus TaxID=288965 RepID=UPI0004813B98|nr:hypothetical protein [Acetivibrio clariflavus]